MRALLLCLVLAAGCSTTLYHPNKGDRELQADLYECEKDAAPQRDDIYRKRMIDRCLAVKGWSPAQ